MLKIIRNQIKGSTITKQMEAISTASHLFPCHSSITKYTRTKRRMNMPYSSCKFQRKLSIQAQAFMNTIAIAAVDSPSSFGGDVSVLIPVSAVLLFVYWLANFVVPSFIMKDLAEPEASERENTED